VRILAFVSNTMMTERKKLIAILMNGMLDKIIVFSRSLFSFFNFYPAQFYFNGSLS
jgi:hypothetical protein